ncbi:MAG: hypothetical protein ACOC5T_00480 [Elusimicrobiota bacterium]
MKYYKGFNDAVVGVQTVGLGKCLDNRIVYDYNKFVDIFVKKQGVSRPEADDYISYNILPVYTGEDDPIFIFSTEGEDDPIFTAMDISFSHVSTEIDIPWYDNGD